MPQFLPWPKDEIAIQNRLSQIVEDAQLDLLAGKDPCIPVSMKKYAVDDEDPKNDPGSSDFNFKP